MSNLNCDPKKRIIQEASALFAKRGFSGVGVREIAKAADVNISMISYYFGGKIGLLKSMIEEYFISVRHIILSAHEENDGQQARIKSLSVKLIRYIRDNMDLCKVVMNEIPYDLPEVLEYKIEMLKQNIDYSKERFKQDIKNDCKHKVIHDKMRANLGDEEFEYQHKLFHVIISPAYMSLIYSHFVQKDVIKKITDIEFDDKFYDYYAEIISALFYKGISGIMKGYMEENV